MPRAETGELFIILLAPVRGRGGEKGKRTFSPPLLASPPSEGEEYEARRAPR